MVADNQNTNDFPLGFMVKDKSGQLKRIQDDSLVDLQPSGTPQPLTSPKPSLAPQTPISASSKAAFYFAPEDEDEIKKHAEALKELMRQPTTPAQASSASADVATAAQKVVTQAQVHFDEEILNKRFEKVIESFFNEVRTALETEEVLVRPQKIGGLALEPGVAKKVVANAQAVAATIKKPVIAPGLKTSPLVTQRFVPEQKSPGMMAPPPPAFVPRPQPKPQAPPSPPPVSKKVTVEPATGQLAQEIKKELADAAIQIEPAAPQPPPKISPVPPVPSGAAEHPAGIAYVRPIEPSRPQMVDIKQPMNVVGPVEELGLIDAREFRKLGRTPNEAAQKIMEKIELLQEESWQMRMDGIKAWKRSDIVNLYIALGRASIDAGVPLRDILRSREREGKPCLSLDEFLAINNINSLMTA